jgi:hypothetical protein
LRFSGLQFDACQPAGNGSNGQTGQLSLAALGDLSAIGLDDDLAGGVGGGETIASCKCAHCKFMIINLRSQSFENSVRARNRLVRTPQNGALSSQIAQAS